MPDPLASAKRFEAEVCKLAFRIDAPVEKCLFLGRRFLQKVGVLFYIGNELYALGAVI